jgi:hypothetical protein
MRTPWLFLALIFVPCSIALPAAKPGHAKHAEKAAAVRKTHDAKAEAYKLEQQSRLVYWIYTYQQTLTALQQGALNPIRPYPRQAVVDSLFQEMSPGGQAYARKLQQLERRTMAEHAPNTTVDRHTVIRGIHAILAGLRAEQKLVDAMPVAY